MGSKSSQINSNSHIYKSEIQSLNSAKEGLEDMDIPENSNTKINRVWISKRNVTQSDEKLSDIYNISQYEASENINDILKNNGITPPKIEPTKTNLFNIKNGFNRHFKHWALILELNNYTYVNVQFGRTGISLKEFSGKERCENVLYAISETWGQQNHPLSFCELGIPINNDYKSLRDLLDEKKEIEKDKINKNKKIFYNFAYRNCQNFVCEIEKVLFKKKQFWHSFPYYLEDFYQKFFEIDETDMNRFLSLLKDRVDKKNQEIYENNLKSIEEYATKCKDVLSKNDLIEVRDDFIKNCKKDSLFIRHDIYGLFKKNS